ncbi:pentaheme c-type cytochrome TorC [Marinobacter salexigens]|uniref:pentaheme c-type cytochrome TorC n=1 Tax=Marinobacter salexigens TaxID=1925763 RepID=UPI000C2958F8|nr:pentaheme c-type cytochrome TorC [Marinobacter salexigens]
MIKRIKSFWRVLSRPPVHISLGLLVIAGFVAGIIFWGGFNTALEVTNTEAFCISCHEMKDNVFEELKDTVHYENRTGVRATCPDCHVPHNWTDKIARKMQASKEVWGAIFGTINTPEKFEAKRLELAQHEWARFSANNSLECRNCHDYDSMDWDKMGDEARRFMKPAAERNQSCLDCHKGIAHNLPKEMNTGVDPALARLMDQAAGARLTTGETYYTVTSVDLYTDPELQNRAGYLDPASSVNLISTRGDALEVQVSGWRKQKGFGRIMYEGFGLNVASAVLEKEVATDDARFSAGEDKVDDLTGLAWEQADITLWAKKGGLLPERDALWGYADQTYSDGCSVCHGEPAPAHFDANTWPAMFSGMVGFTNMNAETQALVLKYLQLHSSDFAENAH